MTSLYVLMNGRFRRYDGKSTAEVLTAARADFPGADVEAVLGIHKIGGVRGVSIVLPEEVSNG